VGCDGAGLEGNGGGSPTGKEDRCREALGGSDDSTNNGTAGSGSASIATVTVAPASTEETTAKATLWQRGSGDAARFRRGCGNLHTEEEQSEVRPPAPEKNGIAAASDRGASDHPGCGDGSYPMRGDGRTPPRLANKGTVHGGLAADRRTPHVIVFRFKTHLKSNSSAGKLARQQVKI
jgi:hypothetical protein